MPDLMTRLAALHDAPLSPVDDVVVASDLRRGHAALINQRRRRGALAGVAALGVVAIGSLSHLDASGGKQRTPPQAIQASAGTSTLVPAAPTSILASQHASRSVPLLELVAYHGKQLPGYTVERVPKGYVLQGISGSVLDVAAAGDHSSLNLFGNKLVVMLNDHPGPQDGERVTVNGRQGRFRADENGTRTLTYNDGTHNVELQVWRNIKISRDQLVSFAEGVTVLPGAQEGHG
jgi:hypothetical protein